MYPILKNVHLRRLEVFTSLGKSNCMGDCRNMHTESLLGILFCVTWLIMYALCTIPRYNNFLLVLPKTVSLHSKGEEEINSFTSVG
jgi:hypothetical protein